MHHSNIDLMVRFKQLLIFAVAFMILTGCSKDPDQMIGVKIYDYHGDYYTLVTKWSQMGINTAFVSTSLAGNDSFRLALKKNNIKVFIIFPVFQNPEILKQDSSLYAITNKGTKASKEWVEFVCPSRLAYRNLKINELTDLIRKLDPDGISIDFIRQFVYWEKIYADHDFTSIDRACYCDSCLAGFTRQKGISIPDACRTTIDKAEWIEMNYLTEWDYYRCDLITSMVKELSAEALRIKKGLIINVHAVPWRENDFGNAGIRIAGQDLQKISSYADLISPMCYSQMLDRDAGWISDVVSDMDKHVKGKVLPSIQVYPYYIDKKFTADDFKQCVKEALKSPSRGVVFFSWPLFEKDSLRMEVVSRLVHK